MLKYTRSIQKIILDKLVYPAQARESGFQGTVKLSLHLLNSGRLLGAEIKSSSGYKVLDDDALQAAEGVSSYNPFPPSIETEDLWIDIPVAYRLD
ncbi:MAG: energy transducer TonB [Candidatus Omnitrophota bacterium]